MNLCTMIIFLTTFLVVQVFGDFSDIIDDVSRSDDKYNVTEANLNDLFDANIDLIKSMIYEKNLDPLQMPDRILGASDTVPLGTLHLRDGWVHELATIKRTGDVIARYHGKNLTVEFDLGWDDIEVNYAYTFRALFYSRQGYFNGYFRDIRIAAQGNINLETYNLELKFFKIIDAGQFSFQLTGHIADYLINAISSAVTTFAKERILREIEYHFTNSIREKIDEINELLPEPMEPKFLRYL